MPSKTTSAVTTLVLFALLTGMRSAYSQQEEPPPLAMPEPCINCAPAFLANVAVDRPSGQYRGGDTLSVTFLAEKDAYVYLLYQQADGKTVLLFPNKARPDNFLKAKTKVSIPERGQPFRFRIQPPFGEEWLQVVASEKPLDCLAKLDITTGEAAPVGPETLNALVAAIKAAPAEVAEHRVKLHTQPGDAPLPPPRPPTKAVLVIGVSAAKEPAAIPPRPRYKNSPLLLADLFVKHCGVDAKNVKRLVDMDASKPNIEEAITKWLPSVTAPGDVVYVYYHGHGGRVKNYDGTEADGYDECLYPADYVSSKAPYGSDAFWAEERQHVVLDDSLARWLQELPGRQIVLLLDTCHSGGAVDAVAANRFFANEGERIRDISQLNTTVVTTALPDEVSWGGTNAPDAVSYFAHYFQQGLEKLPRPVTVKQIFEFYKKAVNEYYRSDPLTAGQQEPTYANHAVLDIELVPKP